jgi:hypothetical protein
MALVIKLLFLHSLKQLPHRSPLNIRNIVVDSRRPLPLPSPLTHKISYSSSVSAINWLNLRREHKKLREEDKELRQQRPLWNDILDLFNAQLN